MEEAAGQFHFNPESYLEMVISEVPSYEELEDRTAEATIGIEANRILDLGTGTGETAVRVAGKHPTAHLLGIDESPEMLAFARRRLPEGDFMVGRLEDPLPHGQYDLVVSALAVHHLDGPAKAHLFLRIAERLVPGGRFVMADLVIPDDPDEAVTPVDGVYDKPSSVADLLKWLREAGLNSRLLWSKQDLALLVADRSVVDPGD
jgi:tRNA (cmo5U34)-methyltransferase